MHIGLKYFPLGERKEGDKKEIVWKIEAYKEGVLRGEWEFVSMRIDPHHPNPNERFYLADSRALIESGKDLAKRLISEGV